VDDLAILAVNSLRTFVQSLVGAVIIPSLQTTVIVTPVRITPTGLGGFVDLNIDPIGDIVGRRVDAIVTVLAEMPTAAALTEASSAIIQALLTAGRKTLVEGGIQRLVFADAKPTTSQTKPDGTVVAIREIRFEVLFEFLKRPEDPEDVISAIPLNLTVS
jgi:hypothetical protein